MMQFNCCRDDDPVRKVPIEEVESPNEHIMDGVSRMNVTGDANAIKLDHVAIVVPPQAEDTDAPAPEAVAAADAVPEAALPADEDEEIKGAMGAFGMADYINGKGMAKQLVNDGIYKGVSPVTLASNMGQIWKGVIGEFADATELATTNTEDKPLRGFLSHSWRSSWWAKHLCLLFTWYAAPVGFVSILSTAMAMYLIGLKGVFVYYIVFPVGLFMGPTVSTMVNQMTGRPRPLYFLDKCCIAQSPHTLKMKGIYSLDKYLGTSQTLVVLYDEEYFTRTWCMYEIATYLWIMKRMKRNKKRKSWVQKMKSFGDDKLFTAQGIKMIALPAAPYLIGVWIWSFLTTAGLVFALSGDSITLDAVSLMTIFCFVGGSLLGVMVAMAMLYLKLSKSFATLKDWTWDKAECTVAEDKILVRSMIAKMYATDAENNDYADGMEYFEKELVQGQVRGAANITAALMMCLTCLLCCFPMFMVLVLAILTAQTFLSS